MSRPRASGGVFLTPPLKYSKKPTWFPSRVCGRISTRVHFSLEYQVLTPFAGVRKPRCTQPLHRDFLTPGPWSKEGTMCGALMAHLRPHGTLVAPLAPSRRPRGALVAPSGRPHRRPQHATGGKGECTHGVYEGPHGALMARPHSARPHGCPHRGSMRAYECCDIPCDIPCYIYM